MDNKYNLGQITLYARIVTLSNGSKAYSVTRYTYASQTSQIPFGQGPEIEAPVFLQLWNSPNLPDIQGTDPHGECNVNSPFLKYVVKDQGANGTGWAMVGPDGKQDPRRRGYLSLLFPGMAHG
jgi:hypothetical protein